MKEFNSKFAIARSTENIAYRTYFLIELAGYIWSLLSFINYSLINAMIKVCYFQTKMQLRTNSLIWGSVSLLFGQLLKVWYIYKKSFEPPKFKPFFGSCLRRTSPERLNVIALTWRPLQSALKMHPYFCSRAEYLIVSYTRNSCSLPFVFFSPHAPKMLFLFICWTLSACFIYIYVCI